MRDLASARVLVTGGAGFIGSALVWALNGRQCERIVVADFLGRDEKWRNLAPLRFEDYLEADDLLSRLESGALGTFDLVLHMGACSATTERDAAYLIRNNYQYTQQLCRWCVAQGIRFVYASSAATYGDGSAGMEDGVAKLSVLRPLNMYGYSKHLFDVWAARQHLFDSIVGVKFFNVFGPNEGHKGDMRSMVHKAFAQVRETGRVELFRSHRPEYRDGEQLRDFVYVKDAVSMTLALAECGAGGLFNIGSGRAHTWLDLVTPMFGALGCEPAITFVDMPEALRDRYQYHTRADISRLQDVGCAVTPMPLAESVWEYVTHYLVPGRHLGD
jgi:ADP-L-glycero-D-manno-heptose 6-epimerase